MRHRSEQIRFDITADEWLNLNQRYRHWSVKAHRTKALRRKAFWAAKKALADGALSKWEKVRIVAHISYPTARAADPNNAEPTTKALVDGLVDAGVITDDSHRYVIGPDHRIGVPTRLKGQYRVLLTLEEPK